LENSKVSFSIPTGGIYGEVGVNTFRNAIGAHYLPHSNEYVAPPSIDVVRHWFLTIRYREEVFAKGTLRKSLLPPRWRLLMAKIIQCLGGKTGGFDQITNIDAIILYSLANDINIDYANIFLEDIINKLKTKQRESLHSISISVDNAQDEGLWRCKEETKGGSSKAPTSSKTGHSKKRKESSLAMDSNPIQPLVSTPVDTGMHKEDHQATDGQASLGVTSEERANPRLSSGCDASAYSTAKATPGLSVPNDSIPQQQGMDERTKNTSFDHISVGTNPHVLVDQTQSVSEGLETVLTQPTIGKGINSITRQAEEESSRIIKLEDLAKLVSNVQTNFKDLNSPEDDPVIVVDNSDEDEEDEVHTTANAKTEDTFSQKHKLELEKKKPEAEAALLKAQPSFPNMGQLNELLVKSLQTCDGRHIHLTEEEINHQKKLEKDAKAEAAKQEGEVRKAELVDLLGPDVVNKYNDKLQYDRYYDKMLNKIAESRIINCDVLTRKGPITLKVYRENGTNEIIPNFKANGLHLGEWREVVEACLNRTGKE
ncbi:hypothetical protein Tco_0928494, partial [Tanacetum coccineum]